MSANNHQQQQAAPAVVAPAASSEYLKRTCLICGCHTNQTINIYEPRSGPNIVQLIQAKFKFQPLNEDKFLCFSCNNWLINWHSLQAVNSNEAESQSQSPSHMGNNVLQQEGTKLRPVAMVRPQVRVQPQAQVQPQPRPQQQPQPQPQFQVPVNPPTPVPAPAPITYAKRRISRRSASVNRVNRILRQCCLETLRRIPKKKSQVFQVYLRQSQRRSNMLCRVECVAPRRRPIERVVKEASPILSAQNSSPTYQRFPQPSVDGKVVAMFRRLGTTLSREQQSSSAYTTSSAPQIMSPSKERPRWTRDLDEDEILLEFDSAISEVLPTTTTTTTNARRCLSYQVTQEDDKENGNQKEDEDEAELEVVLEAEAKEAPLPPPQSHRNHRDSHQAAIQLAGLRLPRGLSISLV
ncbi:protein phyllopod [Drosophila serrata]|uniref:protein phyllopod n=1 Tax=Drosophila serrata TaxID=7274 RepID=UPI000A1CF8F9|nr:protein phyllopod [Drosophila serrata]